MRVRLMETDSATVSEDGQELVDAVVAAIDITRAGEVTRVHDALDFLGLAEAFADELRLTGVPSRCDGTCWMDRS